MYLHEDRETFRDLIEQVADKSGRTAIVVEKDYYHIDIEITFREAGAMCI